MAGWVDLPNYNPVGSGIDAFMRMAQHKQAQEQQAIDNLLKKKQMEQQEAQMRAQEARAEAEAARQEHYAIREQHQFEAQQHKEALSVLPQMDEQIAAGNVPRAQAMGQVAGINNLRQTNMLDDPGAGPQAPQPGPAGPIPSQGDRDYAASQDMPDASGADMMQASNEAQSADQQMASGREQYAQALAAHPQLVAEHAGRLDAFKKSKANPTYTADSSFGPVSFDPGAARAKKQQQQEQMAAQLSQGFPSEYQAQAAAQVKSGIPAHEVAASLRLQMKADEDHRLKQQGLNQQLTRDQRYKVGMNASSGREKMAQHADDRQGRTQFHQDIATDAKVFEKEYRTPYIEANKALKYLDADANNPEAWIAGRDFFVKMASGGKVTKAQYDQAAGHSAPTTDRLNQILEGWTTGLPSETQRKNLRAAVSTMAKVIGGTMREKAAEFDTTYGQDPLVAGGDKVATGTYKRTRGRLFGDVPSEEAKTGKPQTPLARAAKIKALPPEDQGAVKMALERLNANPNDEVAKKVLALHGM